MSFDATPPADTATEAATTLAVVIEGQRLAAGLVDASANVIVRDRIATPPHDAWPGLERMIRRVLAAAPSGTPRPAAVATVCSGPIDAQAGSFSPPYIYSWSNFPLRERLEELTELPVSVDSLAGAVANFRARGHGPGGAESAPSSFLEVLLGSSVDSACVVAGRRLRGAHGNAGSLAHVTVEPEGKPCWCGARGCAETYLSTSAIESEINRPLQRTTPSIVERTGIMLGRALSTVAVTVDVSAAYVSGPLVETLGAPLLLAARTEIEVRSRLPNVADLAVLPRGDAPLLVAAMFAGRGG